MRIAIAGFQHETNTFVEQNTCYEHFLQADSWPEMLRGRSVIDRTRGTNLGVSGFVSAAETEKNIELLPILWCSAEPGGPVTDDAFERVYSEIARALSDMAPLDAVYLELHGAMVTQSLDDGEGTLLKRIRETIGQDILLVASLDMHANITQEMVQSTDVMTIYRTYPHIDIAETGARAFQMLWKAWQGRRPAKAWRQVDYLIPLHAQHTGADPARALYKAVEAHDQLEGLQHADLALGFTAADIKDVGPSMVAYAATQETADGIADDLMNRLARAEPDFETGLLEPSAAVAKAKSNSSNRPVVIADVQDNPGAGASSDTTGLLRELMRQNARDVLLGLVHDPALARLAHAHGPNTSFDADIGGNSPEDRPLRAKLHVQQLTDGQCVYTGDMYGGGTANLGPSAALRLDGTSITIVVTSIRNQCLDLAHFRHFGLSPETARILCVKSTAHFRADFEPIAQEVLLTAAPGQFPCVLKDVTYSKLRPGVRLEYII